MRRHLSRLTWRVGRRGALLLSFGAAWVLIGQDLFDEPPIAGAGELFFEQIPNPVRAWAWILFGLFAIVNAFRIRGDRRDWTGFAGLYVMPAVRAVSFAAGWIASLAGTGGYPAGGRIAILYALYLAVLVVCSDWAEPAMPPLPEDQQHPPGEPDR